MDSTKRRIDKELAAFIRMCYRHSYKTQEELAFAIDVEPRTLKYYFSGERKPSQKTLLKLLKVANINGKDIPF